MAEKMTERKYYDPEIETMDRERLRKLQLERLKWQVKRCYEDSEFYREKFKAGGITPQDIQSLDDITRIPFVTKQEERDEQVAHPPFGRYQVAPRETWGELHPSSGTTGIAVNTIWTYNDVKSITDWTARTMWNCGIRPHDIVQNGFSYGLWVAGMSTHYACQQLGCFVLPIGAAMSERHVDYLVNPGSTVLLSTPSFAFYIMERFSQRGISPDSIPLRIGLFGGEGGIEMPATRKAIEEGLGIQAYDYHGLAEIGPTIASECEEKAGLHWVEDHLIVEVINPKTKQPCAEGEQGVLVITHLTKEASPMLRYWTNDVAMLTTETCACGRTHARSPGGILGRLDDMIIYKGTNFYPIQIEKVVRGSPELSNEFIIELTNHPQYGTGECTIMVEHLTPPEDMESLRARVKEQLRLELMVAPEVEILPLGSLERSMFKAKRLVDKRDKKTGV